MHLHAQYNDYARAAGDLLDDIPKAVWAAIAVSALTCGGDHLDLAQEKVVKEWLALHVNGIVPQAPRGKTAKAIVARVTNTPEQRVAALIAGAKAVNTPDPQ